MNILITIIINIFIGALLYVIISLKLEKSASEFREKRLRKEMDDIIKEFNATAERNISILENRISIMKKMINRIDVADSYDIDLGDNEEIKILEDEKNEQYIEKIKNNRKLNNFTVENKNSLIYNTDAGILSKKSLINYSDKLLHYFHDFKNKLFEINDKKALNESDNNMDIVTEIKADPQNVPSNRKVGKNVDVLIEKDFSTLTHSTEPYEGLEVNDVDKKISNDEIDEIISSSSDKYSMISHLHKKGISADDISRYSGIPEGEVKLILNIHRSL